jgi:quercetin dioxygenase-like cupin family protein
MIAMPAGIQWTVLVNAEQTGGNYTLVEARELPGSEPPRHVHSREDEFVYVLEGRVTFERDGEWLDRPAGTWMFLPRGSEHAFTVQSDDTRLLVLLAPAGLEHCLRELSRSDVPAADPQMVERLVSTMARYGVSITGPVPTSPGAGSYAT